MTTATMTDHDALVAASGPVSAAIPVQGGLEPRAVDAGTDVGTDPGAAGWTAAKQLLAGGRYVVLALPQPLADACELPLPELMAQVADLLDADAEADAIVLPAGEALGGIVTGPEASAVALGADDMDMGLLVLVSPPGSTVPERVAAPADVPEAPGAAPLPPLSSVAATAAMMGDTGNARMDLLHAVDMEITCELGRARMTVRELLSLRPGAVVELDRSAGSPVDLLINGTLFARGEVVVIDEEYGVRVTEIVGPKQAGADAA